jgi:hypothetical protein
LACARHLTFLGYNVVVLEGRKRIGGRVHTITGGQVTEASSSSSASFPTSSSSPPTSNSSISQRGTFTQPVDLGAMVTTGTIGNPTHLIASQMNIRQHIVLSQCDIYQSNGRLVPPKRDLEIESVFNRLLDHMTISRRRYRFRQMKSLESSVTQVLNGPANSTDNCITSSSSSTSNESQNSPQGLSQGLSQEPPQEVAPLQESQNEPSEEVPSQEPVNQSRYGRKRKRVNYDDNYGIDDSSSKKRQQKQKKITSREVVFIVDKNEVNSIPFGVRSSCPYNIIIFFLH